jgi:hypothetical protein
MKERITIGITSSDAEIADYALHLIEMKDALHIHGSMSIGELTKIAIYNSTVQHLCDTLIDRQTQRALERTEQTNAQRAHERERRRDRLEREVGP